VDIYVYWFSLALLLLGLEMATGTFYLLALSAATAVGGLAALLNLGLAWQLMLCAVGVVAGIIILRSWKRTQLNDEAGANMDIGQPVQVLKWHDNGSARVFYRGAEWDAEPESADMPREGTFYIVSLRGSSLVLTHRKSQHQ
jgi:membrane protein implicated in regulation of membrane protease activity